MALDVQAIPLSLYVHWPWCIKKCPYCDFNSHALPKSDVERVYIDTLLKAAKAQAPYAQGRALTSLYIGGGTPSLISAEGMRRLLEGLRAVFVFSDGIEISMEANPGASALERFSAYKEAGLNRLSVGVQSFTPRFLQTLERIHSSEEAQRTLAHAINIFDHVNVDLMYALPGQTKEDLSRDLDIAMNLGVDHFSCYQLTIEEGTRFFKMPPKDLPDEDEVALMSELIEEKTSEKGFKHYEISGYAKPASLCQHNLNYWTFGDYLAIGAGAHGKITTPEGVYRFAGEKQPQRWIKDVELDHFSLERVDEGALPFEFMLNALRLREGVATRFFEERTGLALSLIETPLKKAQQLGLLEAYSSQLKPTEKGFLFLSDLQELFL